MYDLSNMQEITSHQDQTFMRKNPQIIHTMLVTYQTKCVEDYCLIHRDGKHHNTIIGEIFDEKMVGWWLVDWFVVVTYTHVQT